jgi:hypothetical protein
VYHTSRRKAYISSHETEGKRELKTPGSVVSNLLGKREKMFAGNNILQKQYLYFYFCNINDNTLTNSASTVKLLFNYTRITKFQPHFFPGPENLLYILM